MSTERLFQAEVNRYAWEHGWFYLHIPPSFRGGRLLTHTEGQNGWPDLVAVRGGRIVVAELKAGAGRLSPAQQAWLDAWRQTTAEVYVWRDSNWPEIEEALR